MVASPEEGKRIAGILLSYLPVEVSIEMMEQMWEEVGMQTDNESLEETILLLKKLLESEWEYSLQNQEESPSQGHEY
tara:strand:+ start:144 stop:374 length:231 start_codon:yes stop_codon:yes gene_type:complete